MSSPLLLQADEVSRSWGNQVILDKVSIGLRAGESTAIVGPSGSGKTTLLALLALLLEPSAGRIRIGGRDASGLSDSERSRLRNQHFGFVFQSAQLVGSLTVLDNALLPAMLAGKAAAMRARALELLERLGLEERAGHVPHQLSVGQRRRVALARALLLRPAIVLADEPTNDLDPRRAAQIEDFLLGLPAEGYAVVLVTHDARLAGRADRCFEIRERTLRTPHRAAEHAPPLHPIRLPEAADRERQ